MSSERVSIVDIAASGTNSADSKMVGGAKTESLGVPRGLLFRKKSTQISQPGQTHYEPISSDMFNTLFDKITVKEPKLTATESKSATTESKSAATESKSATTESKSATTESKSATTESKSAAAEPHLKKRPRSKKTRKIPAAHTPKKRIPSKKTRRLRG